MDLLDLVILRTGGRRQRMWRRTNTGCAEAVLTLHQPLLHHPYLKWTGNEQALNAHVNATLPEGIDNQLTNTHNIIDSRFNRR